MENEFKSTVELQNWLLSTGSEDKWWLCIDGVADECTLTLKEIVDTLVSGDYPNAQVLHASEAKKMNPEWMTVFHERLGSQEYERQQVRLESEQRIIRERLEAERRIETEESLRTFFKEFVNRIRTNGFDSLSLEELRIALKNHHACLKSVLEDSDESIMEESWNLFQLSANSSFITNIHNAGEIALQTQKIQNLVLLQQYQVTPSVAAQSNTTSDTNQNLYRTATLMAAHAGLMKLNQMNKNIEQIEENLSNPDDFLGEE